MREKGIEKLSKDPVFNKQYISDLGNFWGAYTKKISSTLFQKIQNKLERFYEQTKNNLRNNFLFWCFLLKNRTIEQKLSAIDHSSSDLLSSEQLERKKIGSILADSPHAQLIEYLQKLEPCTEPKSPFIVSLASLKKRVESGALLLSLISFIKNTIKPKAIVIHLLDKSFPTHTIDGPFAQAYKILQEKGVTIRYVKNDYRPHNKYFYTAQEFPHSAILLLDDDRYCNPMLFESLIKENKIYPHAILVGIAFQMIDQKSTPVKKNPLLIYKDFPLILEGLNAPSLFYYPNGGGGIFFPKGVLPQIQKFIARNQLHVKFERNDDDVLKVGSVMLGFPIKKAKGLPKKCFICVPRKLTGDGLWEEFNGNSCASNPKLTNVDITLHNIFSKRFPEFDDQNVYEKLNLVPNPEVIKALENSTSIQK